MRVNYPQRTHFQQIDQLVRWAYVAPKRDLGPSFRAEHDKHQRSKG